jgi:rhamnogalacturonyl hydrolase YesR
MRGRQKLSIARLGGSPEDVLNIINKVNVKWQSEHSPEVHAFWDVAVYQTGDMAAYAVTGNENFRRYAERWAEHNQWMGARSGDKRDWKHGYGESDDHVLFGDWQVCFQTYIDLYELEKRETKIARAREVMEYEMSTPENDYWWWADGLYMVMPVMAKLYKVTGNRQYLYKLYEYFAYACSIMYDPAEGLYYRDARYVYPKHTTINGKKDFWARGDGWVLAALVRTLRDLPATDEHYQEYVQRFKDIAAAVKGYQQPQGYWTRSMGDPEYGERAIPGQVVDRRSNTNFGVGVFLLAASEVYLYMRDKK